MMTHTTVLTGTTLLTLLSMFSRRAQVLTECSCVSWTAHAFACDVVACSIILAQTFLLAIVAISGMVTEVFTSPAMVPGCTYARSSDGVTQRLVLTLTPATAVWAPVITVTRAGAVSPSPARLTLTGVGGHAAAMHTFLSTVGNAYISTLIETWAALRLASMHCLLTPAIGRSVAYSVLSAFEPVEDVRAAGVVDLIKRMSVRLLHGH